jgi:hypothetical protein
MTPSLFDNISEEGTVDTSLGLGTAILRAFARKREVPLLDALFAIAARSPFRHMVTPGGFRMSVAMTNCGSLGWVTDRKGYRYDSVDPETRHGRPCPSRSWSWLMMQQRWPAFRSSFPMDVSSIAMSQVRDSHCIRTRTNVIMTSRLCRCRLVSLRCFSSEAKNAATRPGVSRWITGMLWSGVDPRGCAITESCHSRPVCIPWRAHTASISRFARRHESPTVYSFSQSAS